MLSEIDYKASTGKHRIRGCGATRPMPTFDDLIILPSQLSRMSIDTYREDCETRVVLGKRYAKKTNHHRNAGDDRRYVLRGAEQGSKDCFGEKPRVSSGTVISNGEGGTAAGGAG